jgi:cell division septation protein DedD
VRLYSCRNCGKLVRRRKRVCWNCGTRWPALSFWFRLLWTRSAWAAAVLIGAIAAYRTLPQPEPSRQEKTGLVALQAASESDGRRVALGDPSLTERLESKAGPGDASSALDRGLRNAEPKRSEGDSPPAGTGPPQKSSWSVQVAAFRDAKEAERLAEWLRAKGYEVHVASDDRWHRVRVGGFASAREAGRARDVLAENQGFLDAFVTRG